MKIDPSLPLRSVILNGVKDPRLHFHVFRWNTVPCPTAVVFEVIPHWRRYRRKLKSSNSAYLALGVPMLFPRANRRICRTALVALCLPASVIVSFAQGENTIIEKCGKLHTQAEMNDCAATEAKKADAALNTTFRELLSRIRANKTATERLIAAEKAWIIFRDAELAAEWPVAEGENPSILYGSVHPFCFSLELASMTWDRVKTLKDLMQHKEGDVCSSGLARNNQADEPRTCNSKPERLKMDGKRSGVS